MIDKRLAFEVQGNIERTRAIPFGLVYEQPRMRDGVPIDRVEMAINAFSYFESVMQLDGACVKSIKRDEHIIAAEMRLELCTASNWISIPPPFPFSRYHGEGDLPDIVDGIPQFFKVWDFNRFNKLLGGTMEYSYLVEHVFKHSTDKKVIGLPWVPTSVLTLKDLTLQKLSVYNRLFAGDSMGPFTVNSCHDIYPGKINHLVAKYDKPTRVMSNLGQTHRYLFDGLRKMYTYMDMTKNFGRLVWDFRKEDVIASAAPSGSSFGLRAGPSKPFVDPSTGIKTTITCNGTKYDQEKFAKGRVLELIQKYLETGKVELIEKACCICLKFEIFNSNSIDKEKRKAFYLKCREFFIMNFVQYIIASLVMKDRQMFERGRMIKVGMRWWHGGAQYFADQMGYKNPDMIYFDGDYEALDTTFKKHLLELYESQAFVYYDEELSDMNLFEMLLKLATENIAVKMVHIFARIWKLIIGIMPSGAYETSHGNSWLVGLLFWAYIEMVKSKRPQRAAQIDKLFREGKIEFPVYGDDHVIGVHKSVADIINEEGYASFVKEFFGMKIHKIRNNIPFLSVPDEHGGLKVDGVIFLKRRLIKRPDDYPTDLPDVLPYKNLDDVLVKLAWGNNPRWTLADYAISAIGLAYDGMGTNPVLHEICLQMFVFCVRQGGFASMEDLRRAFMDFRADKTKDITRVLRKIGIPLEKVLEGFPSRDYLLSLHKYDKHYVNFSPPFQRWSPTHVMEWDRLAEMKFLDGAK